MSVPQHFVFEVAFDKKNSKHVVQVCFHRTLRGMRSFLTKRGHKDSSHTLGCCWQNGRFSGEPGSGCTVAEIHLPLEGLRTRDIIHESVHAGLHRTRLLGSKSNDFNEENLARDVENVAREIMALWRGIKRLKLGSRRRKK